MNLSSKYSNFIFEDYIFDESSKELTLKYSMDGGLHFEEIYTFDFDFNEYDHSSLDKAFQQLFFIAGVSYYKTYIPDNIVVKKGSLSDKEAAFYSKTYQRGLGEFWYVNNLAPSTEVKFHANTKEQSTYTANGSGFLVSVGGGKDSLVSIELLKEKYGDQITTWSLNHKSQLEPLIERIGLPHYFVDRQIDQKLLNSEKLPGSMNGHIPISAIFACTGVIVAILSGKRDVVVSNERSADEATLIYQNISINHQYSKTSEFEADFGNLLKETFGKKIRYYSLLRPLCEVQIAKLFIEKYFDKYKDVFSSCNKAFVHGQDRLFWDAKCSKCTFVNLVFAPFISQERLTQLLGHNLLLDKDLENTYRDLLGLTDEKPLECIGEITESRWCMDQMKTIYPELEKYAYPKVPDEEIYYLAPSLIPEDIAKVILPIFEQI